MKVGDRVRDLVLSRGEGRIVSFSFCEDSSCSCPGFVQVHWDINDEPDQEGQDFLDDVEIVEESK